MILTKKKAIGISIELWEWLAETGKLKWDWDGWDRYGRMNSHCPFCEYEVRQERTRHEHLLNCPYCPYYQKFDSCTENGAPFDKWEHAKSPQARRKYAQLFLEQLRQLKEAIVK